MRQRQVLLLLNALIFLAHGVRMVRFSSWQVSGQHRCLVSAECAQKGVTDAEAQNVILQFHSRQECDTSVWDLKIT